MTELLRAHGLAKSFRGLQAVAGASFTVAEGEIAALIGPNGAGKTTTILMLLGLTIVLMVFRSMRWPLECCEESTGSPGLETQPLSPSR